METNNGKKNEIPFIKPARVGNFKVWRNRKTIGTGRDKAEIEQINVSTLDEGWQIRIPATYDMFGLISELFGSEEHKGRLVNIFSNMLYASCIANGYFQQAVNMCASCYASPNVLNEEDSEHEGFVHDVKALVAGFLEWRREYEKKIAALAPDEDEDRADEVADEMMEEVIGKEKPPVRRHGGRKKGKAG